MSNDDSLYLLDLMGGNMIATINDEMVISFSAPTSRDGAGTRSWRYAHYDAFLLQQ